jgi:hypothetical protein
VLQVGGGGEGGRTDFGEEWEVVTEKPAPPEYPEGPVGNLVAEWAGGKETGRVEEEEERERGRGRGWEEDSSQLLHQGLKQSVSTALGGCLCYLVKGSR